MTFIILLTHWADMTFSLNDVLYIIMIVTNAAWAYFTIKSNKREIGELKKNPELKDVKERIGKLEKKYDDLKEIFGNFKVQMAEMKFEIIEAVQKMFNGKKRK